MKKIILSLILLMLGFSSVLLQNVGAEDTYNGFDYMWFEPGHYLHYTETIDTTTKDIEVVYQETVQTGIFITLNFLDDHHYDSSLLGDIYSDKILFTSGFPSSNEFNYWFLVTLPQSFQDGDMWKHNDVGYRVDYVGNWDVNGETFTDVIKISINSLSYTREYSRGEGEVYLAKNVGIIDWEFRKVDASVFRVKIEDWGELSPHKISGRLTLDGRYPAKGYFIGLSNKHENDGTGKLTDENGCFSITSYGHKHTLRYGPVLSDGSLDFSEATEVELTNIQSNVTNLVYSMGYPPIPVEINVDDVYFKKDRLDLDETASIFLHLSWAFDGTDASEVQARINSTNYYTNETGWLEFTLQKSTLGKRKYVITYLSDCEDYNIKTDLSSPIWDSVQIPENQTIKIQQGDSLSSSVAYYQYDSSPFQGSFILNDTITTKPVGSYKIQVTGVNDILYGLSQYSSNTIEVIVDQLDFIITLSDDRVDVGTTPEVAVSGKYQYDNKTFTGVMSLSEPNIESVSEQIYRVESIQDYQYDFTDFYSNEVPCIWDRLAIVDSGSTNTTTLPGETVTIWFKVVYEYDEELFDPTKGSVKISGNPAVWNSSMECWELDVTNNKEEIKQYLVTEITDDQYQISVINHLASPVDVEWKTPIIEKSDEDNQGGIPSYPLLALVLGILLFRRFTKFNKLIEAFSC